MAKVMKSPICQTRHIKVHSGLYQHTVKDKHHAAFDQHIAKPVPWLNIKGQWLAEAGFDISTPVTVRVMEGCLVLTAQGEKSDD